MINPFDNTVSQYLVLVNDEGQYSLWPAIIKVPGGWNIVYGESTREECVDYIKVHWTDLTPNSLKKLVK